MVAIPSWMGRENEDAFVEERWMWQPLTIRLIVSLTAMDLGEMSGFDNGVRDAPAIQGASEEGAFPADKMFTAEVNAHNSPPFSMLVTCISFRWLGLKPERSLAKPVLNFLIIVRTFSVLKGFTGDWRHE